MKNQKLLKFFQNKRIKGLMTSGKSLPTAESVPLQAAGGNPMHSRYWKHTMADRK